MAVTHSAPETLSARAARWLTASDHKRVGIMTIVTSMAFFVVAGVLSLVMRAELSSAGEQIVGAESYNRLFTLHGTAMIFLFAIPVLGGLAGYLVPLQIGAREVAFPRANALSFWLLPAGGMTIFAGYLVEGGPAACGWTCLSPLSQSSASPGSGVDLWIAGLLLVAFAELIRATNLITTILRLRKPGMSLFEMPWFTWSVLVSSIVSVLAVPVLMAALSLLYIDRNLTAGAFFGAEGDPLLWQHLFWFYGRPALYALAIPAIGIVSEIVSVFSGRPLAGNRVPVFSLIALGALAFASWGQELATSGGAEETFFSIPAALLAVPLFAMVANWVATMRGGRISLASPMLFALGFASTLVVGAIAAVFSALTPVAVAMQDTYWEVSSLHYALVGSSVFAVFAALHYWMPKMTGRPMTEGPARMQALLLFAGFHLAFAPMFFLGADGLPARVSEANGANLLTTVGAALLALSVAVFVVNWARSIELPRSAPPDPWKGRTLEWTTSSPPPEGNFVEGRARRPVGARS